MKSEAISKINMVGRISSIIILICKIFLIIGILGTVIGFVSTALMPADLFTAKIDGKANVTVNLEQFTSNPNVSLSNKMPKHLKTNIIYNGSSFHVTDVKQSGSKIHVLADGSVAKINMKSVNGILIAALIDLVMVFVTFMMAGFLAKAFRDCVSPFEENVIKKMKYFAISLIPWAFISMITKAMIDRVLVGNQGISFELDLNTVFVILVILALTYIFKYGAQLQKESDETL